MMVKAMNPQTLACVLGDPIQHSLSPELFSFLAGFLPGPGTHLAGYFPVKAGSDELEQAVWMIRSLPFRGCNVTIPNKEVVMNHLDKVTPEAQKIGAVNVIEKTAQGKLIGHNTDVIGILETFKEHRVSVRGKQCLVLGAGGAARAACFALGMLGAKKVFILTRNLNKSQEKACHLAEDLCQHFSKTSFTVISENNLEALSDSEVFSVVVNATPLGLPHSKSIFHGPLKSKKVEVAFDVNYRPAQTAFMRAAGKRGCRVMGGLDMFVWQALATWEIWFQKIPNKIDVKKDSIRHLRRFIK